MSVWKKLSRLSEGPIVKTTEIMLSQTKIDKNGRLDDQLEDIAAQLDQFVEQLNTQNARMGDRSEPIDPKRVSAVWKQMLELMSGQRR